MTAYSKIYSALDLDNRNRADSALDVARVRLTSELPSATWVAIASALGPDWAAPRDLLEERAITLAALRVLEAR